MNQSLVRTRLLFNPLFRALWMGMIAAALGSALLADGAGLAMRSLTPAALLIAAVRTATSAPMCLLLLLSVVASWYVQGHGPQHFAFRKMGSGAFAASILTFLGLAGPWVVLCSAFILGLCTAIAVLSLQPLLPQLLGKAGPALNAAFGVFGVGLGRTACNLVCGILATAIGPAAIFILSAISLGWAFIAGRRRRPDAPGEGAAFPASH